MSTCAYPSVAKTYEPTPTEALVSRVAARFAWLKTSTVVLRDVPEVDWAWGWFANGLEPRMMIEPMCVEHRGLGCVYLETADGQPAFEPAGNLHGIGLDRLRQAVEANRQRIETAWVCTMCCKGWLRLTWDRRRRGPIKIIAYAGTPNERVHELPFWWLYIIGDREPWLEDIAMDRANGVLVLGAQAPVPTRVSLPSVLWPMMPNSSDRTILIST